MLIYGGNWNCLVAAPFEAEMLSLEVIRRLVVVGSSATLRKIKFNFLQLGIDTRSAQVRALFPALSWGKNYARVVGGIRR